MYTNIINYKHFIEDISYENEIHGSVQLFPYEGRAVTE